ncbi:hypothetical protein [Nodosilinea sp. E11]|uniref:hypothetical protein n=1 Tax=Nodosilinea sp. E11 TaxID=3037479 RepID=UPI00293436F4|nr:hypothetical protein [Nodosilinea sp. E11]WOD40295.1 hypothetical protein RRF56_05755 [Nodosilinea sp. E11]
MLKRLIARSGLEFWLPLGLLGVALWLAGLGWSQHYLAVSGRPIQPLVLAPNAAVRETGILSINATINRDRPFTRVEVTVVQPVPRTLDFYLPLQTPSTIEAEMARRLKVSEASIRQLIHYENIRP